MDHEHHANLRTNLLQQGEDDGGPSQKFSINQLHNQLQVKVQDQVHILLANAPRLEAMQVPYFVHYIFQGKYGPMYNISK